MLSIITNQRGQNNDDGCFEQRAASSRKELAVRARFILLFVKAVAMIKLAV